VLKFYFKNVAFGEQLPLNTISLAKIIIQDSLNLYSLKVLFKKLLADLHIIPKISVIMSVYNGENYLKESIESILSQDFKNFEFLIVDDGSNDKSYTILKGYAKNNKRIKIFKNNDNLGLTKSLNLLLNHAKAPYIARMDSDDISLPTRLSKQYKFLSQNKDIFLVGTRAFNINSKGKIISHPILPTNSIEISDTLPKINCIHHPTIMFRNEGYSYREKFIYAQDYDFYLNLLSAEKNFYNLKEPLLKYRITEDSVSHRESLKQRKFAKEARKFYLERVKNGTDSYNIFKPNF